jgi:hypothetical protein
MPPQPVPPTVPVPTTPYWQGQPAPPAPPSAPSDGNRRPAIIAAVVAVVALLAGGIYFATKGGGDDEQVLPRDSVESTESSEPSESTDAPTTEPATTTPLTLPPTIVPSTTAAPTTTALTVPAGALDLGYGVFFPVPAGWSQTNADAGDEAPTISNGDTSLTLQAVARTPGEDPQQLLQEYVDTFDTDFEAVAYDPSQQYDRIDGPMPIDAYGITYRTYDSSDDDGVGLTGLAEVFVRGDGLTVVYDVFSSIEKYDVEGQAYGDFVDSMVQAPALGTPVELVAHPSFRVTSAHEFVPSFGLAGYTLTPGWHTKQRADGNPYASNDDGDFEMRQLGPVGTADGGVAAAEAYYLTMYPNVTFDPATPGDPDAYGHDRRDLSWHGTLDDGTEFAGVGTVWFDATTTNAVMMFEDWYGNIDNPYYSEFNFMFVAASDSFPTI